MTSFGLVEATVVALAVFAAVAVVTSAVAVVAVATFVDAFVVAVACEPSFVDYCYCFVSLKMIRHASCVDAAVEDWLVA